MKTESEIRRQLANKIYDSCEAANDALGPCPRALANSDGGHWWYIDHEAEEEKARKAEMGEYTEDDVIRCVCKSCPQTMKLSEDADEYPV